MNPLISVVIPLYNASKYLSYCIESVLKQSYCELDIILVNDGSTDDSGLICDSYALKDERIRVIHQENAGVSVARNTGIDAALGEWIGFVDSDDWIEPEMFGMLLTAAVRNKNKFSICGFTKHFEDGGRYKRDSLQLPDVIPRDEAFKYLISDRYFEGFMCNKLFNIELVKGYQGVRLKPQLHYCEDLVFVAQILLKVDNVSYIQKSLYHYRMHGGNAINIFNKKRLTELIAWQYVISLVSPISENLARLTRIRYVSVVVNVMYHAARDKKYEYISVLRGEALKYFLMYFKACEVDVKMKIRCAMIIISPQFSYRFWMTVKNIFKISWWDK